MSPSENQPPQEGRTVPAEPATWQVGAKGAWPPPCLPSHGSGDGRPGPGVSRPSFLTVLLRALAAWPV
jgi:hypothetical protein